MGESYLVDGAELRCMNGSKGGRLRVSVGCSNYMENGKQKASSADCRRGENIPFFGECRLKNGKKCEKYMKLKDHWEVPGITAMAEHVNGRVALTLDSVLICEKGGFIVPRTSGQGETQSIDWADYWKRYSSQLGFWARLQCGSIWAYDPVNMNTGNFVYEKEDLVIRGITKLSFHITYYSMGENLGGSIGEGWHHNYEISVEEKDAGILCLHLGDGQIFLCRQVVGDIYAPAGAAGLLKKEADGYRYVSGTGMKYSFDKAGRIVERKNRDGNADVFLHNDSGQLIEVRSANGGALHYDYNKEGNLYRISDHTGRNVRLCYSYRVLCKFINSSGQEYTYHYNENLRLESVTTPRGIIAVKNVYDSANRVTKQITPDGGIAEFRYDDKGLCTYARSQDGYITAYESDDKFRNIRTIYPNSEECFEYNENNQCTLYVDRNGNPTRYFYDERGRLSGSINALGERKAFVYNQDGKLSSLSIEGKCVLKHTYDQNGRLIRTKDALGRSRETVYDENGLPKRMIMPDGSDIKIEHDERGNIRSITDAYGAMTAYRYDALNRLIQITDEDGNQLSYQYDERDNLLSETNPEGSVRKYTYDVSGRPVQIEDFDGGTVSFSYNAMGKPEIITDKEGRATKRSYTGSGRIAKEISPLGRTTVYQYDRDGRLVRIKRMVSEQEEEGMRVTDFTYDPVGNLLNVKSGDGQDVMSETSYEYDALNRVIMVIDAAERKTSYTYDKRSGKISGITDASGNRTFCYNDVGELTQETDNRGNIIRYQYNELGKITTKTDAVGRVTKHYYLPGGRLEKSIYPNGRQLFYQYDTLGRLCQKTDEKGYGLSYEYDSMGRILRIVNSTGQETCYDYDAAGNIIAVTDMPGNITRYSYTASGKLKDVTDPLGNRTGYTYDAEDRLVQIRQFGTGGEIDRIIEYERDAFGQITCIRNASGEEYFCYDVLGRMIEKTDKEGLATAYAYTADGMLKSILYSDGRKAEFFYTPLGQLTMIKDWLGETKIDRDSQGMPVNITDHKGRTIRYEWGDQGERKKLIYPDGTILKWQYDEMMRPIELARTAGGEEILRINYRYDKHGRLSEKRNSGGYQTCWHYNELGQLDELVHKEQRGILDRFCYAYDAMGNKIMVRKERSGLSGESGEYRYTYDVLQRLVDVEKDGKKLRCYQYDSFGNRSHMEDYPENRRYIFTYNGTNQMLEKTAASMADDGEAVIHTTYTYDGRGNLTGEYRDGRLLHGYLYNAADRLEKSWDDTGREAVYLYNALGQRTGRSSGAHTEEYLLDLTRPYNNLLGIEKEDGKQNFFWDVDVAVMEDERKKLHYYMQDDLGSPLRVLYGNGNGDRYGYDEFGRDLYDSEEKASTLGRYSRQGEKQPFGYTGYRYDSVSRTYFAQAREYQPEHGRFMAEDSKRGKGARPKTLNRYGYCWNNPVRWVDLNGKEPVISAPQSFIPELPALEPDFPDPSKMFEIPEEDTSEENGQLPSPLEPIESYVDGGLNTNGLRDAEEVYIINFTTTFGAIAYGSMGVQLVFDKKGNCDVQFPLSGGMMVGIEGSRTVSFGRLRVPSVEKAAGLGFESGVGGGYGVVGGVNLISAYDEDGYLIGDGEIIYFGKGTKVTVVESHMGVSYTFRLEEVVEGIEEFFANMDTGKD